MILRLTNIWTGRCAIILAVIGVLGTHGIADAGEMGIEAGWVSRIISLQGEVLVKRQGQTHWEPVKLNDAFFTGDQIRVESNSRAGILLSNDAVMRLDQNTTLIFTEIEQKRTFIFNLLDGAANFFSHRPRSLKILTPFVNGVVEGTEFFVQVDAAQTRIDLFEGRILAENDYGILDLAKGEGAVAPAGKAPQRYFLVRPRESVQWAMYYPPVLALGRGVASADINQSLALYENGQIVDALARLESIEPGSRDATFFVCRAAILLHVGGIAKAQSDIQQALTLDPENGDALALKAVIAVVQNRAADAVDMARQAVKVSPQSASAHIALSYALQAAFKLSEALDAARKAVTHATGSGLAWARLADLQLSVGALDKGVSAAQKAVALAPRTAHAHTILGFAHLTRIETKNARESFNEAIALDSAAPLPRLGLGLADIRDGDLERGRSEIEIAAGLDPGNSLIRSYLGKAYFDEKRDPLDGQQFDIAKSLDPNDPTPWFYDAIRKQSLNRPVEALHDLQRSIDLNDNRAIYRSRLLLDQDLAARSASIGRIYQNLGFEELSLRQGWNSLNIDPGNYSAHRLLADTSNLRPRHEIARVSEILQSQLLQPININPIQPTIAESNLFFIANQGLSAPSFNTYNPLFNRNQTSMTVTGYGGSNSTWGGEGIVSGIYNRMSLSAGYTNFSTDGFRSNCDQDDSIADVFAQYEFTNQTSVQGEYRYRNSERGDTQLRFFADNFDPGLHQEDETNSTRIGFRHTVSPSSIFIGNFGYQDADLDWQTQRTTNGIFMARSTESTQSAYGGELGFLFDTSTLNIVSGAGYFDIDVKDTITATISIPGYFLPPPAPPIYIPPDENTDISNVDRDVLHTNFYLYSYLNILKNMTVTLGASGDLFNSSSQDETDTNQFNPKFGISWNPVPNTTLRGAVFRVLKRTLITDQTIEPTQVAGFNQFYDDADATDAWNYGIAIDQVFTENIFGGIQMVFREMKLPFIIDPDSVSRELTEADWKEKMARSYLFWTPHEWFSFSAEWLWERFDRERFAFGVKNVETNYFPLGLHFFHPFGVFATLKGTYVKQSGSFERQYQAGVFEDGEDDFFVADVSVGYRLPKRYGLVTLGVTNLFEEDFNYYDADPDNPRIQPDRYVFARVTLVFP